VREALASCSYLICIGGIGKTALALEVAHESLKASKGDRETGQGIKELTERLEHEMAKGTEGANEAR